MEKEIFGFLHNPALETAYVLTVYGLFFRIIPYLWNTYSKTQMKKHEEEGKARDDTRKSIKKQEDIINNIEAHLVKINGHVNEESIHMPRPELFGSFVQVDFCKEFRVGLNNAICDVQKDVREIYKIVSSGNGKKPLRKPRTTKNTEQ